MVALTYQFSALDTVVEEAHVFFEPLLSDAAGPVRASMMLHLQLAVHEWLANLVQHARFPTGSPEISLAIDEQDEAVVCVVEDNSDGFDLEEALRNRREGLSPLPERGMGLLILFACAREIHYDRHREGKNTLRFVVSDEGEKTLNIPF
mgnify:CR=1 FL=1